MDNWPGNNSTNLRITVVIVSGLTLIGIGAYITYMHSRARRVNSKVKNVRSQISQFIDPRQGFTDRAAERMLALLDRLLQQPRIMRMYPDLARTALPQVVEMQRMGPLRHSMHAFPQNQPAPAYQGAAPSQPRYERPAALPRAVTPVTQLEPTECLNDDPQDPHLLEHQE